MFPSKTDLTQSITKRGDIWENRLKQVTCMCQWVEKHTRQEQNHFRAVWPDCCLWDQFERCFQCCYHHYSVPGNSISRVRRRKIACGSKSCLESGIAEWYWRRACGQDFDSSTWSSTGEKSRHNWSFERFHIHPILLSIWLNLWTGVQRETDMLSFRTLWFRMRKHQTPAYTRSSWPDRLDCIRLSESAPDSCTSIPLSPDLRNHIWRRTKKSLGPSSHEAERSFHNHNKDLVFVWWGIRFGKKVTRDKRGEAGKKERSCVPILPKSQRETAFTATTISWSGSIRIRPWARKEKQQNDCRSQVIFLWIENRESTILLYYCVYPFCSPTRSAVRKYNTNEQPFPLNRVHVPKSCASIRCPKYGSGWLVLQTVRLTGRVQQIHNN